MTETGFLEWWCLTIWAGLPYYEDLLEIPVDYVEDYTLQERVGTAGRQQQQQRQLHNKNVFQDFSSPSGSMSGEECVYT